MWEKGLTGGGGTNISTNTTRILERVQSTVNVTRVFYYNSENRSDLFSFMLKTNVKIGNGWDVTSRVSSHSIRPLQVSLRPSP